ncbi:L1 [Leptonychotes weddellii papillomavirus 6]|uniref:Major capsid protein L1 n=1 Tax=Leptonychotes weddellii papillomavirus 6 TaxID=2077307 RepID=A0A2I8B2P2_9PAPI|nr:L1 [Leptonychotes weddellii papillomavirus 6]AUT11905.1 L1 [Leptonychotes weddellii papillomavirus 6]
MLCIVTSIMTLAFGANANANSCLFSLQMPLWLPSNNKVYLPPTSVSRVISTEDYVQRLPLYYCATSSRLLVVGHPYFALEDEEKGVTVPKVSANQYRVFRIKLPDPNRFGLPDTDVYDPDKERLVWGCIGVEVGRGQPLGIGLSGNPLFNRFEDTENPGRYKEIEKRGNDSRQNVSVDNKQTQLLLVGCTPPTGEHWALGRTCDDEPPKPGACPPLVLLNTVIEDGDMFDTGFGAMDFKALQASKSEVPLDISQSACKYPDYLKMNADQYGDPCFFYVRKEQMFARHFFSRQGTLGDAIPEDHILLGVGGQPQAQPSISVYSSTPSGSLVSSETQIFNRPYWLHKAQGHNNGICWNNEMFVTLADNTRGTNLSLSVAINDKPAPTTFTASNFNQYMRHCEEYELQFMFQVCKVVLNPENMAYLHTMNPDILDNWNLGITPPLSNALEDSYRFYKNNATTCPAKQPPKDKVDPYDKWKFWKLDFTEKFSSDLDQYPLGRKFLLQSGVRAVSRPRPGVKRSSTSSSQARAKRKRR